MLVRSSAGVLDLNQVGKMDVIMLFMHLDKSLDW